ncbi:hypothetical protein E8E13_005996 [Curvularia kusanoi]|uniref:Uncharacterized protein n=1 Tax=Curvularia kusanoi TaxID=90978 RepID=A0A9P4T7L1_CURKU|nr:hypothetical protein E8E13_005996 [Curvularia kusanoi]
MSDFHIERKEFQDQKEQEIGNSSSDNASLEQMELEQANGQKGHQANNFGNFMSNDEEQRELNNASAWIDDESSKSVSVSGHHTIQEQMKPTEANGETHHGVGSPADGNQFTHAAKPSDEEPIPATQEVDAGGFDIALDSFSSQKRGLESLSEEDFDRLWDD